jgi:hypothetical protein
MKISNPVGITGVLIVLIAYYFLSIGRWSANQFKYQWTNFIGAWLILFSLYFHWNLSSVLIEIAWIAISLVGIFRIYFPKKMVKNTQ